MDLDWADDLLSDAREVVDSLIGVDGPDLEQLVTDVLDYRDHVHAVARPLTDLDLADALAERTVDLLRAAHTPEDRELASIAARYFLHPGDDLYSPFGFDDDLEVFNAIASRVAPELVLAE